MARIAAATPSFSPPDPWTNQDLILYHGTVDIHYSSILQAVDVTKGRHLTDFGRGFYTTTLLSQAGNWAWRMGLGRTGSNPVVIEFTVSRDHLATLESVWFAHGAPNAESYWSLVCHCRSGGGGHARISNGGWYDIAIGPLATSWRSRSLSQDGRDQVSFHTSTAAGRLDSSSKRLVP